MISTLAKIGVAVAAIIAILCATAGMHQLRGGTLRRGGTARSMSLADVERDSLLSAENEIIGAYYTDMLLLPIEWAEPRNNADAFTDCRSISFVADRYRFGEWDANLFTLKHEIAHVAAGCDHGHDGLWRRELARLMAAPTVKSVRDIQSGN
jgi:hypothetical protein